MTAVDARRRINKNNLEVILWQIEYTDEFEKWWNELSQEAQKDVASVVGLLEEWGCVSTIRILRR